MVDTERKQLVAVAKVGDYQHDCQTRVCQRTLIYDVLFRKAIVTHPLAIYVLVFDKRKLQN